MPRTTCLQLAAAGVALLAACSARAESPQKFLFGGDFPMQPSDPVKSLFYESGMNCIRLTGGGYGWAAGGHKKLADEFQERGLFVYLQLGSHYPSADYFPLTEAYMVDHAGQTGKEDRNAWSISYSGQHWPQYSYAHEGFRRKLEGDFASYLRNFATNTNAVGVILHNEPGFFWLADRIFDHGAPAVANFRAYLHQQHGTIEKLNERWGSSFTSFAEVTPPGKPPVQNIAAWMDWRRYSAGQIAEFMAWESEWFGRQRGDVPRTTNLAGPLDHWFGYRCAQNATLTAKMDVAGIDIYPTQWTERVHIPYSVDMSHGVAQGRPVHVLECDVFDAKVWKGYSEEQRAEMLRGELWTMIGHGSRAVLVWGFSRGDEFSLTNGEPNPRYLACRDIAHTAKMVGIDDFARPRPQVAVCVDPDSYIYASGVEAKPHQLSPAEDSEARGLYAALSDAQVPSDVILTPQLRSGVWKNYRAIVLASHRMMDEQTTAELEQFVASGGVLIADGPLGQMDRWGKRFETVPGAQFDRLFGIRSTGSQNVEGWATIATPDGQISADAVREQVQLAGAAAIATLPDGAPGITSHQHGKGKTIFINGRAGVPYMNGNSRVLARWLAAVVSPVTQGPRVYATSGTTTPLDTSILQDARGNLLVVASTLGSKGKPAPAIANAELGIMTGRPNAPRHAYLFVPTHEQNGMVTSGPAEVPLASDKAGIVSLTVSEITSVAPILLTVDAPPLLAIRSPTRVSRGQEIAVTVTCFNPSPRPVEGTIALQADAKNRMKVSIAPNAKAEVSLRLLVAADAAPGRMVINAVLVTEASRQTLGIPVDVQVD